MSMLCPATWSYTKNTPVGTQNKHPACVWKQNLTLTAVIKKTSCPSASEDSKPHLHPAFCSVLLVSCASPLVFFFFPIISMSWTHTNLNSCHSKHKSICPTHMSTHLDFDTLWKHSAFCLNLLKSRYERNIKKQKRREKIMNLGRWSLWGTREETRREGQP